MFFRKRKFYTLLDIKKHLIYTPLIFVFIASILSILVIIFILEFKKNNEVLLLQQEDKFNKKTILNQYVRDIKFNANASFDDVEISLNKYVNELSGLIKFSNKNIQIDELKKIVRKIENSNNIEFVIFNTLNYDILHGKNVINHLQTLTNSRLKTITFRDHMLKNIIYIGDDNLIYWIDNQKRNIRLSYFKDIKNKNWFLGAFSKINDVKASVKNTIINSISQTSKYYNDRYFWFFDNELGYVYNYYNKNKKIKVQDILTKDRLNTSNKILKRYIKNRNAVKSYNVHNFVKYNYLVSVKSYTLPNKVSTLEYEYNSRLSLAIAIVIVIALFLIVASVLFSQFINKIFHRYNKRLEMKNILYKKWKDRYELAIIASNDGLWDIDLKTEHIFFSKKWLEMFGYINGDINTLSGWINLIHPEDKDNVNQKLSDHLEGKSEHFICEYRIKDNFNNYKWILVRGKAFEGKNKKHKRMLMLSMDINQRKALTKELQHIDLLVEYGRIVIFKWKNDEDLTVKYLSKSINSYGYDVKDFESKKIKYFDFIHEDDVESFKKDIEEAMKSEDKLFTKVHRVKDKDGQVRWVFNRTIFLKDDFGNITHLYGYINDITRMKLHEEELKLKIRSEVAKNTEKDRLLVHQTKLAAMGEMLGNIAHQWRQPLNNVNLLTHFIRDNYGNFTKEELDEVIQNTKLQIDYMSKTIDDFRNFYEPNKDKIKFNIRSSIELSVKIVEAQFEKSNIALFIEGGKFEIINYENEFQQVIVNILNNASDAAIIKQKEFKFKPEVNILISKVDNKYVEIVLSNNCGEVLPKVMERMFEPYFTTKFENQGTGIGLYMAKVIIEKNMNGKISVDNIKDGIAFTINLPI